MSERWFRAILAGFGIAAIAILLGLTLWPRGFLLEGKPLQYWVQKLSEPDSGEAELVLARMGPEVVPLLLRQANIGRESLPLGAALNGHGRTDPTMANSRLAYRMEITFRLIGSGAVPQLLTALEDNDAGVRLNAARAIGAIWPSPETTLPVMLKLLHDPDCEVRDTAVMLLNRMRYCRESVIPALVGVLKAASEEGRTDASCALLRHAVAALGQIGAPAEPAVPELNRLLTSSDHLLRQEAALALCRINYDTEALALLNP